MNRYEAIGLSPEEIEKLAEIAAAYTVIGCRTSVDDLVRFMSLMNTDFEKLQVSSQELAEALKFPWRWYSPILWAMQDALDALRRLLWDVWLNAMTMSCPAHYLGGGWEPEACGGCPWQEKCERSYVKC